MVEAKEEDFYEVYPDFRIYQPPNLKPKHSRQFDQEFWIPSQCSRDSAVLEIGSGTGLFLAYLQAKQVERFFGIDTDAAVLEVIPESLKPFIKIQSVWDFLDQEVPPGKFDHIVLFDVFEHFSPHEGVALLEKFKSILSPGGRVTLRVPNMASPWGLQYQYHDLTHKAAYTSGSIKQVALAAGYECLKCLPQRRKRGLRRLTETSLEFLVSKLITEPPGIWSANFIAVLEWGGDPS